MMGIDKIMAGLDARDREERNRFFERMTAKAYEPLEPKITLAEVAAAIKMAEASLKTVASSAESVNDAMRKFKGALPAVLSTDSEDYIYLDDKGNPVSIRLEGREPDDTVVNEPAPDPEPPPLPETYGNW